MMNLMPRSDMHNPRTPWPLPLRALFACIVGVLLTCIIYWENWHRDAGNAVFKSLVDDYGMSFRASQPVAEVGHGDLTLDGRAELPPLDMIHEALGLTEKVVQYWRAGQWRSAAYAL